MQKEFVPYEQALELKELGFDELCLCFYNHNSQLVRYMNPDKDWNSLQSQTLKNSKITLPDTYSAPTFSQAFRWFREKYTLDSSIIRIGGGNDETGHFKTYRYSIFGISDNEHQKLRFRAYEEAELECLIKLIEIVKQRK